MFPCGWRCSLRSRRCQNWVPQKNSIGEVQMGNIWAQPGSAQPARPTPASAENSVGDTSPLIRSSCCQQGLSWRLSNGHITLAADSLSAAGCCRRGPLHTGGSSTERTQTRMRPGHGHRVRTAMWCPSNRKRRRGGQRCAPGQSLRQPRAMQASTLKMMHRIPPAMAPLAAVAVEGYSAGNSPEAL